MARHYGTAILPVAQRTRRQGESGGSGPDYRALDLVRLRRETFSSVAALNDCVATLLEQLNDRMSVDGRLSLWA